MNDKELMKKLKNKEKKEIKEWNNNKLKIGIIIRETKKINIKAIKYLILEINKQQSSFEFALVPYNNIDELDRTSYISHDDKEALNKEFRKVIIKYKDNYNILCKGYELVGEPPDYWIVITTNKREDRYYWFVSGKLAFITLGYWNKKMAPPSLVECIVVLMVEIATLYKWNIKSHLETMGCIFDFTHDLNNTRFKVLSGYICEKCRSQIPKKKYNEISDVLKMNWLGDNKNENTPASISRKLGYNLFRTKSFKPRFRDKFFEILESEGSKELIKLVALIIGTGLLIWLGFKIP
jgi:hypothetical protein